MQAIRSLHRNAVRLSRGRRLRSVQLQLECARLKPIYSGHKDCLSVNKIPIRSYASVAASDTIFALSSGNPPCAVSVIRVTGCV